MSDNAQPDMDYQPPVKGYVYSNSNPAFKHPQYVSPNPQNSPRENNLSKLLNTILALGVGTFTLLTVLTLILLILNYYNLISLSILSPAFKGFPKTSTVIQTVNQEDKPNNIPGTNQYEFEGTFEKYDQNFVYIKLFKKTIKIEYNFDSQFYLTRTFVNSDTATPAAETIAIIDFPSNILKQENLGKKVSVQYIIENNKNILQTLTLNK